MPTQTLISQYDRPPLTVDRLVPTVSLRFLLGRTHVATPPADVEAEVRDRIVSTRHRAPADWTDDIVEETVAAAVWLHAENLAEYRYVMGGCR